MRMWVPPTSAAVKSMICGSIQRLNSSSLLDISLMPCSNESTWQVRATIGAVSNQTLLMTH